MRADPLALDLLLRLGGCSRYGFDLARQFPMEYSVELKRLIDLEMEGSVG